MPADHGEMLVYLTAASLSYNVCCLLYGATHKLLEVVGDRCRRRQSAHRCAPATVCRDADNCKDISRLVSSAVTLLVTAAMTTVALYTTDVATQPFVYYGDKEFLRVIHSTTVGRYLFLLSLNIYFSHTSPRDRYVTYLHHVATLACYVTVTYTGANLFLPLLAVFMELDEFIRVILQLLRQHRKPALSRGVVQAVNVTGLLISLCFRVVLPITGVAWAMKRQQPQLLDPVSIGALCFGGFFFTIFNTWSMKYWAMHVVCEHTAGIRLGLTRNPLIITDTGEDNAVNSSNQMAIRNDLTASRKSSQPTRAFGVKSELLILHMAKVSNLDTASNLQSNFSNQAWSKKAHSVSRIGGVKATEAVGVEDMDRVMDPLTEIVFEPERQELDSLKPERLRFLKKT